mgnify:CR=1 FL=1|jgi:hypothetical protein
MRLLSKSALAILVAKIEELAAVRVNLNLLTDKSVMKLAESLSLIQRNVKENKMMNRIHRASKQMNKLTDKDVRCGSYICRLQLSRQSTVLETGRRTGQRPCCGNLCKKRT